MKTKLILIALFFLIANHINGQTPPSERREIVTTYDTVVLYAGLKEKHDWAQEQTLARSYDSGRHRICRKCYRHERITPRTYYKYTGKPAYEAVLQEFKNKAK